MKLKFAESRRLLKLAAYDKEAALKELYKYVETFAFFLSKDINNISTGGVRTDIVLDEYISVINHIKAMP